MTYILSLMLATNMSLIVTDEERCLQQICQETGKTQDQVTEMLTTCSVKLMEGSAMYFGQSKEWKAKRLNAYPEDDETSYTRITRAFEYEACIEMTNNFSAYMKACTNGGLK